MKIVIVSSFYSQGMGYTENCLPRTLSKLGYDVHLITSQFNVYGTDSIYKNTYQRFLGDAIQPVSSFVTDGYTVHRLESSTVCGYVWMKGLQKKILGINPDIVHCLEIASLQSYAIGLLKLFCKFKFFTETHQHLSVVRPYVKSKSLNFGKVLYWLTRTFPTFLISHTVEKCYAIAPDCVLVATKYYGVPQKKVYLQSIGSDTAIFHPVNLQTKKDRLDLREELGFSENDIVCVYSGRLSSDKNPLILAKAIDRISRVDSRWKALFIGEGEQKDSILLCNNSVIKEFMSHKDLARHYRVADIGIWPRQESVSMLDAAASGLPIVVSNKIGDQTRVEGNGLMFIEDDDDDLSRQLLKLDDISIRNQMGKIGTVKINEKFSWLKLVQNVVNHYEISLSKTSKK